MQLIHLNCISKKRGIQVLKYNSVEKLPYEQKTYEIRITHKLLLLKD